MTVVSSLLSLPFAECITSFKFNYIMRWVLSLSHPIKNYYFIEPETDI